MDEYNNLLVKSTSLRPSLQLETIEQNLKREKSMKESLQHENDELRAMISNQLHLMKNENISLTLELHETKDSLATYAKANKIQFDPSLYLHVEDVRNALLNAIRPGVDGWDPSSRPVQWFLVDHVTMRVIHDLVRYRHPKPRKPTKVTVMKCVYPISFNAISY